MLHPDDGVVSVVLLAGSCVGIGVFGGDGVRHRSATVRARGMCRLWRMEKNQYDQLRARFPAEDLLFQDFLTIVQEIQRIENESRQNEWERSVVNLKSVK